MQKRSRKEELERNGGICETEPVLTQKKPQLLKDLTGERVHLIRVINPKGQPPSLPTQLPILQEWARRETDLKGPNVFWKENEGRVNSRGKMVVICGCCHRRLDCETIVLDSEMQPGSRVGSYGKTFWPFRHERVLNFEDLSYTLMPCMTFKMWTWS